MAKNRLSIRLAPKEYSEWYQRTGVKFRNWSLLVDIYNMQENGTTNISNLRLSEKSGLTPYWIGQITKDLADKGIITDTSRHPLRRNWNLTDKGLELVEFIRGKEAA